MTLTQVPKIVKVTLLVALSCFPAGIRPFGGYRQSEIVECEGKKCPLWCAFFYLEPGVPGFDSPAPFKVFCDPSWNPAREPLRYLGEQKQGFGPSQGR